MAVYSCRHGQGLRTARALTLVLISNTVVSRFAEYSGPSPIFVLSVAISL